MQDPYQGIRISEIGENDARSGTQQIITGIASGSHCDYPDTVFQGCGDIVWRISYQNNVIGVKMVPKSFFRALTGDADKIRSDIVVSSECADIQVKILL
jgi:hypothetical protein